MDHTVSLGTLCGLRLKMAFNKCLLIYQREEKQRPLGGAEVTSHSERWQELSVVTGALVLFFLHYAHVVVFSHFFGIEM